MVNRQWTLAMITCLTAAAMLAETAKAETDSAVRTMIVCGFYEKINQTEQQQQHGVLDCRRESVILKAAYQLGGYSAKPKILIPVTRPDWDGRPVWTLSPPLQGAEAVSSLPPEAFEDGLADVLNWTDALSLRRLRQAPSMDLTALARVPRLIHLELAETDATCLRPGLFSGELADRLLSLRLSDNLDLACIQPGALEPLKHLVELRILGSPRLKTLGGAPALPSLTRLEILPRSTGNPESLSVPVSPIANSTFCRIGESLRHLAMDSELPSRYASVLLPSLAGLASLRVTPPQGESPEATVQRFVAHRQAAMCALWPRGDLRLNGILLTVWVADQLSVDYEEFCATSTDALEEFNAQAKRLCSSWTRNATADRGDSEHPDQDVCSDACPSLTTPQQSTTTSPVPQRPQPKPIEASDNSPARGNPGESGNSANWERQGIIGTVLLTSGAFVGGALIAAYCCHSRRRMAAAARLKLAGGVVVVAGGRRSSSATVTSGAHSAASAASSAAAAAAAAERGEQIRLIGFSGTLDGGTRLVVLKETEEEVVAGSGADTRPATEKDEAEDEFVADQWHDDVVEKSRVGDTGGRRREEDDEDEGVGTLLTAEL